MARNPYALTFSRRMALAWRIATSRMAIDATLRDFLGEDSQGKSTSRAGWASTYDATKDRPWFQRHENLTDALAAWRTNPLARRIVNLTRDHVWGNGIRPTSRINAVQKWLDRFWNHELNNMGERWPVWIDALTTDGEVFPTFHQNEVDGMVFVRALAAVQVEGLKWRANDYEQVTGVGQRVPGQIELVWWPTLLTAEPGQSFAGQFAVNKPLGATRGDGDLATALPWLAFYGGWLGRGAQRQREARSETAEDWRGRRQSGRLRAEEHGGRRRERAEFLVGRSGGRQHRSHQHEHDRRVVPPLRDAPGLRAQAHRRDVPHRLHAGGGARRHPALRGPGHFHGRGGCAAQRQPGAGGGGAGHCRGVCEGAGGGVGSRRAHDSDDLQVRGRGPAG